VIGGVVALTLVLITRAMMRRAAARRPEPA